jgi:hypothetical protein
MLMAGNPAAPGRFDDGAQHGRIVGRRRHLMRIPGE